MSMHLAGVCRCMCSRLNWRYWPGWVYWCLCLRQRCPLASWPVAVPPTYCGILAMKRKAAGFYMRRCIGKTSTGPGLMVRCFFAYMAALLLVACGDEAPGSNAGFAGLGQEAAEFIPVERGRRLQ